MSEQLQTRIIMLESNLRELAVAIAQENAGKIHAIKAWRAATGATLKDSKDYIESISVSANESHEDSRIQRLEDRMLYLERRIQGIAQ